VCSLQCIVGYTDSGFQRMGFGAAICKRISRVNDRMEVNKYMSKYKLINK
jgi:hypothetical protein